MSLRLRTALVGIIIAAVSSAAAALSSYFLLAARIETNVNGSLATVSSFFLDEVRRSPLLTRLPDKTSAHTPSRRLTGTGNSYPFLASNCQW